MRSATVLLVTAAALSVACGGAPPPAAVPQPVASTQPAPSDTSQLTTPAGPGRYADVHGLKMYYEVHGDGPPLLLLHSGMGTIDMWPEPIERFAKEYRVIAPEQMGHGHTADDPKREFHVHDMAEDTAELLRQLGVTGACVVGWSDGGNIGLDLAMNHPELVKKLAVSGANAKTAMYVPEVLGFVQKMTADAFPPFMRDAYARVSPDGAAHYPIVFERVRKMWLSEPSFTPQQLGSIKAPTLVVSGDHDAFRISETVAMAHAIPGAQIWVAPGHDHFLPKKDAVVFDDAVAAFFKQSPDDKPSPYAIASDTSAPASEGHYANIHRLRMYYEVHGQGAPLVMLHGGTGSLDTWGPLVADLAKKYQVITPEQMGHGRTGDDPKRAFHFHDMAEDTAELLRQLKVGPAFVFGWSDGGIVALDLAMSHPELVKKLAVSGANFRNDAGAYGDDGVKFMQTIKPEQWPKSLRKSYERRSPDGAKHWPVLFERLRKMWLTEPAYTPEQLGTIKAPTLVVAGDQDVILAEHTVLLFDAIPGAELWLVPNSDHFVPISHAPAFEAQLDAFFQEQPGKKDQ